jgi:hypothetical protein
MEELPANERMVWTRCTQYQSIKAMADLSSLHIHEDLEDGVDHNHIPEVTSDERTSGQMRGWCGHAALQYPLHLTSFVQLQKRLGVAPLLAGNLSNPDIQVSLFGYLRCCSKTKL